MYIYSNLSVRREDRVASWVQMWAWNRRVMWVCTDFCNNSAVKSQLSCSGETKWRTSVKNNPVLCQWTHRLCLSWPFLASPCLLNPSVLSFLHLSPLVCVLPSSLFYPFISLPSSSLCVLIFFHVSSHILFYSIPLILPLLPPCHFLLRLAVLLLSSICPPLFLHCFSLTPLLSAPLLSSPPSLLLLPHPLSLSFALLSLLHLTQQRVS